LIRRGGVPSGAAALIVTDGEDNDLTVLSQKLKKNKGIAL
jgi:hypothetical protein